MQSENDDGSLAASSRRVVEGFAAMMGTVRFGYSSMVQVRYPRAIAQRSKLFEGQCFYVEDSERRSGMVVSRPSPLMSPCSSTQIQIRPW